jgi:hypothetical protein
VFFHGTNKKNHTHTHTHTVQHNILMSYNYCFLFLLQPTNAQIYIYHNNFSLYTAHSYKFWYICIILREFQNLYFARLHKLWKLKLLKLQVCTIIGLKYHLVIAEWYNIVCAMLYYLVKAVCLCGCIYTLYFVMLLLLLLVDWSACTELGWLSGYVLCCLVTLAKEYICVSVGCNKNNMKMNSTCIKKKVI